MNRSGAFLRQRLDLAGAHAHPLADAEARGIAWPEDAALAVVHGDDDLVGGALRELRLHLGRADGAEAPFPVGLWTRIASEGHVRHGADRRCLLDVRRN